VRVRVSVRVRVWVRAACPWGAYLVRVRLGVRVRVRVRVRAACSWGADLVRVRVRVRVRAVCSRAAYPKRRARCTWSGLWVRLRLRVRSTGRFTVGAGETGGFAGGWPERLRRWLVIPPGGVALPRAARRSPKRWLVTPPP